MFVKMSDNGSKHKFVVSDVSRNAEIWVADAGKVLSKQGRTKAGLGELLVDGRWVNQSTRI